MKENLSTPSIDLLPDRGTGGGGAVTRTVVIGYSPEGKPYFGEVKIHAGQPPSMSELPPIDPATGRPIRGFQSDFLGNVDAGKGGTDTKSSG